MHMLQRCCILQEESHNGPNTRDLSNDLFRGVVYAGSDTHLKLVFVMPQEDAIVLIVPVQKLNTDCSLDRDK